MQQFSIDATVFGVLASVYYYGYAGMQIPIAILLDRFSARHVIFTCAVVCGLSMLLFSNTSSWYLALLSRFLIGAGSAVGFLGTSKVISEWFAKDQYSRMVGFSFTLGLIGAIYGGKPVSELVEGYGGQNVSLVLSLISIGIGILTYLFLRSPKKSVSNTSQEKLKLADLASILSSPATWLLAIANLLMVGALEGFADVWGVSYLVKAYSLSKSDAAGLISFIFIGMLFGGPLLALLSKKLGHYTVISLCGIGMTVAFIQLLCVFNTQHNWYLLAALFFCIGIMCCYQVIMFAAGADLVLPQFLGVTIAFLNCINMLGGSFFHGLIGYMMDLFWVGDMSADSTREYTLKSYEHALMIIPICAALGASIVWFVKCKFSVRSK